MNFSIFYNDTYVVTGRGLETVRKANEVARRILEQFPDIKLVSPEPANVEQLLLAHTAEYVEAFLSGEPYHVASAALGEWSEEVVASVLASTGGVIEAALAALKSGRAGSLSSGLHHAKSDHGAGFCTINGLAIAALVVLQNGAKSVGILDIDAHCGGGTFEILGSNPLIRIGDVSTNGYDAWQSGQERHKLEITTDPDTYLDVVAEMLEHIGSVDLLLLNAGMDPADGGSAGSTRGFTSELLEARERLVAEWCERTNTPVAFVLAGGYVGSGLTLGDVADLHVHTVAAIADATITR